MDATQIPEVWRPVVGYEDSYEVSDHGRVRSIARSITTSDGTVKRLQGKILKAAMNRRHRHVALCDGDGGKSYRVHRLVLAAFVGPLPDGLEVRHLDDDPNNNHRTNLVYGTRSENMRDRVVNGIHHNAAKTHCKHGHEFTPENTAPNAYGRGRKCLTCKRIHNQAAMRRKRAGRALVV